MASHHKLQDDEDAAGSGAPNSRSRSRSSSNSSNSSNSSSTTTATTIDGVFSQIGDFGRGQQRLWAAISLMWIPTSWVTVLPIFTNSDHPEWHCVQQQPQQPQQSLPPCYHNTTTGMCGLDRSQWAFDNDYSIASQWDLVCEDSYKNSLTSSLFFTGFLIGVAFGGSLADRFGRRPVLLWSAALTALLTLATAAAPSFAVYAIARCAAGAPSGLLGLLSFVLAQEFIGSSWRGWTGSVSNAYFAFGECLLPVVAWLCPGWRLLTVIVAASVMPIVILYKWVPESPRWLLSTGKTQRCLHQLELIAEANGTCMPPCQLAGATNSNITDGVAEADARRGGHGAPSAADDGRSSESDSDDDDNDDDGSATRPIVSRAPARGRLADICCWPRLRRWALAMFYAWFAASFSYYGLSLNASNLGGSLYMNAFLSGLVEIPGDFLAAWSTNYLGRRKSGVLFFAGAALGCFACLVIVVPLQCEAPGSALCWQSATRTGFALVGKLHAAAAFTTVFVHGAELFPTNLRSLGMGLSSMVARIGGVIAPASLLLSHVAPTLPYVVFGGVAAAAALIYLLLPETRGVQLPNSAKELKAMYAAKQSANRAPRRRMTTGSAGATRFNGVELADRKLLADDGAAAATPRL